MLFTPRWKKDAKLLNKGALKFLNYKRDLLKPDRVAEIESRRKDLAQAVKAGDKDRADEASKQLHATCERALPHVPPTNGLSENIEVLFVAIVIALGLRAYAIQPFRIPTGSMEPTLNGIRAAVLDPQEWPSAPVRWTEWLTKGRSYVDVRVDEPKVIAAGGVREDNFMHFFTRTYINFEDGTSVSIPAPLRVSMEKLRLAQHVNFSQDGRGGIRVQRTEVAAGTVLAQGYVDSGDLVLVDKFSYHFRRPTRGEVFVFETRDIRGIHGSSGEQAGGSHYIKRLGGVPGDTLSIQKPNLLVNGKVATEPGFRRVMEAKGEYAVNPGYVPALDGHRFPLSLRKEGAAPGRREYAALGDNTDNSLDSRYWGPVPEFDLVGPALFALWPIATGHWGFIR
jgi:signal peptidase I